MQKDKKKIKIITFAFGFMGEAIVNALNESKLINLKGIILPDKKSIYYSNINKKKIKNTKLLFSDNSKKVHKFIKKNNPDLVVISTFNKIINKKTLSLSKFINIHHGKLPKQKGRASINWALIMDRNQIYLTIHEVVPKLDSGKIFLQKKIKIRKDDNYNIIKNKINFFLKKNIVMILKKYLDKQLKFKINSNSKETWNCSRNPEDNMINFYDNRKKVYNLIRSSDPKRFGAFCFLGGEKIIIAEANIKSKKKFEGIIPGRIIKLNKDKSVDCLCNDGVLTIKKIYFRKKLISPLKIIKSTRQTLLND